MEPLAPGEQTLLPVGLQKPVVEPKPPHARTHTRTHARTLGELHGHLHPHCARACCRAVAHLCHTKGKAPAGRWRTATEAAGQARLAVRLFVDLLQLTARAVGARRRGLYPVGAATMQ